MYLLDYLLKNTLIIIIIIDYNDILRQLRDIMHVL